MYSTVVTIYTAQWSLYVPHSGHYMYRTVVTICTAQWSLYVPPTLPWNYSTFPPHSCIYVFCVYFRTNSDYFPIQRWPVVSCSGTRVNATGGVWVRRCIVRCRTTFQRNPIPSSWFTLQCRSTCCDDEVSRFLFVQSAHLRNVRTHLPHSTAIPNAVNLTDTTVTSDMTRRSVFSVK
jgi:hypothetical protein